MLADLKIEKSYLINLEDRPERLVNAKDLLAKLGLQNTIIFPAINGRKMNLAGSVEYFTPGMIGCFLSHFIIIQNAVLEGYKSILIFEDDFKLIGNGQQLMIKALPHLPTDWEVVWLGYFHRQNDVHKRQVNEFWSVPNYYHGTHAYMLQGKAILEVYNALKKIKNQLDIQLHLFLDKSKLKVYAPTTKFFEQYGFPTDVQAK